MGKYLARDMTYGLSTAFSLPARGQGIRMERDEGCKPVSPWNRLDINLVKLTERNKLEALALKWERTSQPTITIADYFTFTFRLSIPYVSWQTGAVVRTRNIHTLALSMTWIWTRATLVNVCSTKDLNFMSWHYALPIYNTSKTFGLIIKSKGRKYSQMFPCKHKRLKW